MIVRTFASKYLNQSHKLKIFDIGSYDVNGSVRTVFAWNKKWEYIGCDIEPGPNVDLLVLDDKIDVPDESVDVIVSVSCFEHNSQFWVTFLEMSRILKKGGVMCLIAPSTGPYHPYPTDNWRFLQDSWSALEKWAQNNHFEIKLLESFIDSSNTKWNDSVGIFGKSSKFQEIKINHNMQIPESTYLDFLYYRSLDYHSYKNYDEYVSNCVKNLIIRREAGYVAHYGHFICDFVMKLVSYGITREDHYIFHLIKKDAFLGDNMEKIKILFPKLVFKYVSKFSSECRVLKIKESQQYDEQRIAAFIDDLGIEYHLEDGEYPRIILVKRSRVEMPRVAALDRESYHMNGTDRRRIKNIAEIDRHLQQEYGSSYIMLELEHIDMLEQLKYIYNCKCLIGILGSGLINGWFMQSGTVIVSNNKNNYIDDMLQIKNINFYKLKHRRADNGFFDSAELSAIIHMLA